MKSSTVEYADYAEYDRRQRGILRHLLTAFLGGVAVGLLGLLPSGQLASLYDPYAYLALIIAVGATASGLSWAALAVFLAATSSVVGTMGAGALQGDFDLNSVGGDATGLNVLVVLLVALGLLGYASRRADLWGDLAAGAISALLVSDVIDRASKGFLDYEPGFWPWPAAGLAVLSLCLPLGLRRTVGGRLRALGVALALSGLFALALLGPWAG
ncbi:hypothetical protein [Nonomuraea sp. NPDC050310]|uniref:hypothetical protein n=1 Tax=unclassified Nonomuraea TaxID=2593643 RepID=UPI00340511E8